MTSIEFNSIEPRYNHAQCYCKDIQQREVKMMINS